MFPLTTAALICVSTLLSLSLAASCLINVSSKSVTDFYCSAFVLPFLSMLKLKAEWRGWTLTTTLKRHYRQWSVNVFSKHNKSDLSWQIHLMSMSRFVLHKPNSHATTLTITGTLQAHNLTVEWDHLILPGTKVSVWHNPTCCSSVSAAVCACYCKKEEAGGGGRGLL